MGICSSGVEHMPTCMSSYVKPPVPHTKQSTFSIWVPEALSTDIVTSTSKSYKVAIVHWLSWGFSLKYWELHVFCDQIHSVHSPPLLAPSSYVMCLWRINFSFLSERIASSSGSRCYSMPPLTEIWDVMDSPNKALYVKIPCRILERLATGENVLTYRLPCLHIDVEPTLFFTYLLSLTFNRSTSYQQTSKSENKEGKGNWMALSSEQSVFSEMWSSSVIIACAFKMDGSIHSFPYWMWRGDLPLFPIPGRWVLNTVDLP